MAKSVEGKSVTDLIKEYFQKHLKQDLPHGPVVDWVEERYVKLYDKKPRDPWRAIRKLHQEGWLIKVRKGIYRYDPGFVKEVEVWDFPPAVKEEIFKQDNYKCVACGLGRKDGLELCADHKLSKDMGGTNAVENGETLCSKCNLMKKNYSRTEAAKKYLIKIYEDAVRNGDEKMIQFCRSIFDVYDKHHINGHIPRPNGKVL